MEEKSNTKVFLDDITKLAGSAMDTAVHSVVGLKKQIEEVIHHKMEAFLNSHQVVLREEFEVLQKMVQKLRTEQEELQSRINELEMRANIKE
jgi:BMFP domain-containing protein YqiC